MSCGKVRRWRTRCGRRWDRATAVGETTCRQTPGQHVVIIRIGCLDAASKRAVVDNVRRKALRLVDARVAVAPRLVNVDVGRGAAPGSVWLVGG